MTPLARSGGIRVRATPHGSALEVRAMVLHPTETGRRMSGTGAIVPAHYIERVTCTLDGRVVLEADWGPGVARNPSLAFTIQDASAGSLLRIAWVDNLGGTDQTDVELGRG